MRYRYLIFGVLVVALLLAGWWLWQAQTPLVQVTQPRQQTIEQRLVASGEIRYQRVHQVAAEIAGVVQQRLVRDGDQVTAGQLLIQLDAALASNELDQAQGALDLALTSRYPQLLAALTEIQQQRQQAQRELQRRQNLAQRGLLNQEAVEQSRLQLQTREQQYQQALLSSRDYAKNGAELTRLQQQLAAAQLRLDKTQINAPFSGLVLSKQVEQGDVVQAASPLLTLADLSSLEVIMALDEQYVAPVQVGQSATVIMDAWPDLALPATVSFIAPEVDVARGSLDIHLTLDAPPNHLQLKQGMTASVTIKVAKQANALVIDRQYLQGTQQQPWVWVVDQAQRLQQRAVRLGISNLQSTQIEDGLQLSDRLVLPQSGLSPEQTVRYEGL